MDIRHLVFNKAMTPIVAPKGETFEQKAIEAGQRMAQEKARIEKAEEKRIRRSQK